MNENTPATVFDHYGAERQLVKLLEELGECSTEVARALRIHIDDGTFDSVQLRNLASEIADVEFLFDQVRVIPRMTEWIESQRRFKEERQIERMKEGK